MLRVGRRRSAARRRRPTRLPHLSWCTSLHQPPGTGLPQATRAEALHPPARRRVFHPARAGPAFDRSLSRQAEIHGAGVRPDRSGRVKGAAGAHAAATERRRIRSVFFSAGILAWHPSPRAGDTRRGILALLLRDCNLCGKWNSGTGTWGLEPMGLEPNSVCSAPGLYTLRERGSPVPSRALNSPLSVVKCRGGWNCED